MSEPKPRKFWEQKAWSDMHVGEKAGMITGWCVMAALAAYFIFDSGTGPNGKTAAAASEAAQGQGERKQQQAPTPTSKSLGMTPEEFRREFNRSISEVNKDYKLAEFDIEKGEVNDAFKRAIASNVGLVGTVNKSNGTLKELMIVVSGGKDVDVMKPVIVLLIASQASNPKIPKEENSKVVMAMLKQAMAQIESGEAVERTMGGLQYTAAASHLTGLMFAISPI